MENATPTVFAAEDSGDVDDDLESVLSVGEEGDGGAAGAPSCGRTSRDAIDAREVYELLRHLNDPEHPLTLEQLHVVSSAAVAVDDAASTVTVTFTPTVPHCSMATLIGLCIRVKLLRGLPSRFKVAVRVAPGSHSSEDAVNRQLADKERVAAALENGQLLMEVNKCTAQTDRLPNGPTAVARLLASG